jgi:hypothetical protein
VLQRIWPRLSGQELLYDLFGAPALIRAAGKDLLSDEEMALLYRPRAASLEETKWTKADAALIDEARVLLGPRRRPRPVNPRPPKRDILEGVDLDAYAYDVRAAALREAARLRNAPVLSLALDEAEFVTYGHIVIDEAQDLSPMELRVLKRRDLTGSMTIVGDMGQATNISSSASWNSLVEILEPRRAAHARGLNGQLPHARRGAQLRRTDVAGRRPRSGGAQTRAPRRLFAECRGGRARDLRKDVGRSGAPRMPERPARVASPSSSPAHGSPRSLSCCGARTSTPSTPVSRNHAG